MPSPVSSVLWRSRCVGRESTWATLCCIHARESRRIGSYRGILCDCEVRLRRFFSMGACLKEGGRVAATARAPARLSQLPAEVAALPRAAASVCRRWRQPPVRIQPRAERAAEERARPRGDERDGKQGLVNGGGWCDRSRCLAAPSEEARADIESVIARESRGRGALARAQQHEARARHGAASRARARACARAVSDRDGDDDREDGGARRLRERRGLLRFVRARLFDLPDDELGLELLQRGDDLVFDDLRCAPRACGSITRIAAGSRRRGGRATRGARARTRAPRRWVWGSAQTRLRSRHPRG